MGNPSSVIQNRRSIHGHFQMSLLPRTAPFLDEGDRAAAQAYIKSQRPRALTLDARLDILALHLHFRALGQPSTELIAKMLMRSERVVKSVWAELAKTKALTVAVPPTNTAKRKSFVPNTKAVASAVQTFVRERRAWRERTVAKDVMSFLLKRKVITYDPANKKSAGAALRGVQRFLDKRGYKRGKKPTSEVRLSAKNAVARAQYVATATSRLHDAVTPRTMVYKDESFVHHNYKLDNDSLYDPSDVLDVQTRKNTRVADCASSRQLSTRAPHRQR